ncbi:MAG: protein kinase, partial [Deltaproteobacteria bacterium]|nr:protein kinase [Deltaproteobacteria bacterium]
MPSFNPGALVGREFRIVRPLREGGMGEVYVAEQLSTGRLRALKVLSAQFEGDAGARERFEREARVGASIESDHVVEVVTAGVDEATGCAYLVMELLRGADLDDVLEARGPLPLADVAEIFSQIAHALDRAHELGVVHRDIKPANIFLSAPRRKGASFTAKVLDFGIAKAVAANRLTGTQPLGTPLYMAPEQMERASAVTGAADIWALGLVAFRLLTGRDLWKAADESFAALVKEVVVEPIPFATARAAELGAPGSLPPGFDAWFARAVCRDPSARFATAGELAQSFSELAPPDAVAGSVSDWLVEQIASRPEPLAVSAPLPLASGTDPTLMLASSPSAATAPPADPAPAAPRQQEVTNQPTVVTARAGGGASRAVVAVGVLGLVGAGITLLSRGTPGGAPSAVAMEPPSPPPAASSAAAAPAPPACPEGMVHIAAGAMFMGDAELKNAGPPHRVTLRGFCLDRTEVTAARYDACSAGGHCARAPRDVRFEGVTREQATALSEHCNSSRPDRASHPINCVDWHMADNFCRAKGGRFEDGGARL